MKLNISNNSLKKQKQKQKTKHEQKQYVAHMEFVMYHVFYDEKYPR